MVRGSWDQPRYDEFVAPLAAYQRAFRNRHIEKDEGHSIGACGPRRSGFRINVR
jgi:hypothetical protein